jgi:hypothetical protein
MKKFPVTLDIEMPPAAVAAWCAEFKAKPSEVRADVKAYILDIVQNHPALDGSTVSLRKWAPYKYTDPDATEES